MPFANDLVAPQARQALQATPKKQALKSANGRSQRASTRAEKLARASPQQIARAKQRLAERARSAGSGYASTQESISATPDDLSRSIKRRKRQEDDSVRESVNSWRQWSSLETADETNAATQALSTPKMQSGESQERNPLAAYEAPEPAESHAETESENGGTLISDTIPATVEHSNSNTNGQAFNQVMSYMTENELDPDQFSDLVHASHPETSGAIDWHSLKSCIPACLADTRLRDCLRKISRRFMHAELLSKEDFVALLQNPHQDDLELFWASVKRHKDLEDSFENEIQQALQEIYWPAWPDRLAAKEDLSGPEQLSTKDSAPETPHEEGTIDLIEGGKEDDPEMSNPQVTGPQVSVATKADAQDDDDMLFMEQAVAADPMEEMNTPSLLSPRSNSQQLVTNGTDVNGEGTNLHASSFETDTNNSKVLDSQPSDADEPQGEQDNMSHKSDGNHEFDFNVVPSPVRTYNLRTARQVQDTTDVAHDTTPTPVNNEADAVQGTTDVARKLFVSDELDPIVDDDDDTRLDGRSEPDSDNSQSSESSETSKSAEKKSVEPDALFTTDSPHGDVAKKSKGKGIATTKKGRVRKEAEQNEPIKYKSGVLSKHEETLVSAAAEAVMAEQGLTYNAFCQTVHENTRKDRKAFWSELIYCIPDRKPKNMREYIKKAFRPVELAAAPWTENEKQLLDDLVAEHGHQWSKIGGIMNRYREDCQQVYRRMSESRAESVREGAWTEEEQVAFEAALAQQADEVNYEKVSQILGTRSPRQIRDHVRALERRASPRRSSLARTRSIGKKAPRLSLPRQKPKKVEKIEAPKYKEMSQEDLLRFVNHCLTLDLDSLDEFDLPSDLGEFDVFGYDQLRSQVTALRKKIRNWRTMEVGETLKHIRDYLMNNMPQVVASQSQ